ncbi:MAG TPA: GTP cyclohydrolase II [Blastocatellia bacterium]|nr:GTP cyclohydrolase II [Blastocatellia bacterium]
MQNITQLSETQFREPASLNTVQRVAEAKLPTEFGDFQIIGYQSLTSNEEFIALVKDISRPNRTSLVRIHSQCMTGDVFGSIRCDCGEQLHEAMRLIAAEGHGAIIYQQQEGRGIGIINKIRAYSLQDEGSDTVEANERLGLEVDSRRYEQCAEIFHDLGLWRVRLLSNNPAKIRALEQCGIEIVERVSLEVKPAEAAMRYLRTKKEKMGHLINIT